MPQVLLNIADPETRDFFTDLIREELDKQPSTSTATAPRILSQKQLSQEVGLSVPTLIRLRKKGIITGANIGNKWKFNLVEVWQQLKAGKVKGGAA